MTHFSHFAFPTSSSTIRLSSRSFSIPEKNLQFSHLLPAVNFTPISHSGSSEVIIRTIQDGLQAPHLYLPSYNSPNRWGLREMMAVRVFPVNASSIDDILPSEFTPLERDMNSAPTIAALLNEKMDEIALRKSRIVPVDLPSLFFSAIRAVIDHSPDEARDLAAEDKMEGYVNDLAYCLLASLSSSMKPIQHRPDQRLQGNIGSSVISMNIERSLWTDKLPMLIAVVEVSKKSSPGQNPFNRYGQQVAEALLAAQTNRQAHQKPYQEVFGISVHHKFFSFWHCLFKGAHLDKLSEGQPLLPEDIAFVKRFPVTENIGWNIGKPEERRKIIQALLTISNYVKSGKALLF
eukprot:TRINITY_DN5683_c0_g1_i1.p1 TRINITY_DN5683_c0_g1~~TRINITY_DN5683_c0_g1_i1.p1  ORF type:complete len:364 (-),score=46.26 TRINITY_DN5683_c0_g1_i1:156-1199(-)